MSIPSETTVLVIGGGPGGSYSASALAREGVDVVVLEADKFPRYHIGESMLASIRYFLRFIDLDSTFDQYGFRKKLGAAFKFNEKPEGYTDFIVNGGENNYAWNVVRSEADNLMFQHAGKSGAHIFDNVKIESLEFAQLEDDVPKKDDPESEYENQRPISANWIMKDGSSGNIKFKYLVDASGRVGILSTKYLKNRKQNQGLKNIANWGYWKGAGSYAVGTKREGQPYFESLADGSGWCWFIPLHDGTTSVGIVQNQSMATQKKKDLGSPSSEEFYKENLKLSPTILGFLTDGELVTNIKSASDWSYSASYYATPFTRMVGDAGCFIDPFFSSGVHLALSGALSAAATIRASMRGDIDERGAAEWHSTRVSESYTRFLLIVLTALKQIRKQDQPILSDMDEKTFDRAFSLFRPVIQGTADVSQNLTESELSNTIDFCFNAFDHDDKARDESDSHDGTNGMTKEEKVKQKAEDNPESLTENEKKVLDAVRAREMLRFKDMRNLDSFGADSINGMSPHLKRGELTLVKAN